LRNGTCINAGHAKRRAKPIDHDHDKGEKHLLAKIFYLEDVLQVRKHVVLLIDFEQ
jgi:hypothetical protein